MATIAKRLDGGDASPMTKKKKNTTHDFLRKNGLLPHRGPGRPRKYTPEEAKRVAYQQRSEYAKRLAQMAREAKAAMAS
jgi:hypothetical protein